MVLPEYVLSCIHALEDAGFAAYAVGGCVRDAALGLTPHDYDLCTEATPEQTRQVFSEYRLVLSGVKHGTVGVVTDGGVVEITTFRTEGGYTDSRHPDWVAFVSSVEEDLSRRDFTVNAMAYSPTRGYADPFCGREDLKNGVLRAVGSPYLRFTEDALRILRGVRFAVRFQLTPDPETLNAMTVLAPRLSGIAAERIFDELCKLLPLVKAADLLTYAPIITQVIPELAGAIGFDQRSRHHTYDLYTHTAHVVEAVPPKLSLRFAALLHDTGKLTTMTIDENGEGHFYGHAGHSAHNAACVMNRLRAPKVLQSQVELLISLHMTLLEPEKKVIRRWLGRLGQETMEDLLILQEADTGSKGTGKEGLDDRIRRIRLLIGQILEENAALTLRDLAINGRDLQQLGYTPGKALGACLQQLLDLVVDEQLPNQREALTAYAKEHLHKP